VVATCVLSLSSLAGWEEAVLASLRGASGPIDERDRQIERSGLYGEYPAIVRAYMELFTDPDSSLEATKRALFLVWRGAMALPAETGIADLPDGTSRAVIAELDARVGRGGVDAELGWMLAWYCWQGRHLFELYGGTARLLALAEDAAPDAWRSAGITPATMAGRGQLGTYWAALAADAR
jgi:hypothetical protein